MKRHFLICSLLLYSTVFAQNKTIYQSLETLAPNLYHYIENSSTNEIQVLLSAPNITFFLPSALTLNTSLTNGQLNFSLPINTTLSALSFLVLNQSLDAHTLLATRQFYTPINSTSVISVGPQLVQNKLTANISIYAGLDKALISSPQINCTNGIIYRIDQFIKPTVSPLQTISILSQTEYMENLLKSLNVSGTVSGINKTLLVPINQAWQAVDGTSIPFGTLVHQLKYMTLNGVYTSDQLKNISLVSDYRHMKVAIALINGSLKANGVANLVETDILTSSGIMHLMDSVLDPSLNMTTAGATPATDTDNDGGDVPSELRTTKRTSSASHLLPSVHMLALVGLAYYYTQ